MRTWQSQWSLVTTDEPCQTYEACECEVRARSPLIAAAELRGPYNSPQTRESIG
jgi:hypothetical protein